MRFQPCSTWPRVDKPVYYMKVLEHSGGYLALKESARMVAPRRRCWGYSRHHHQQGPLESVQLDG